MFFTSSYLPEENLLILINMKNRQRIVSAINRDDGDNIAK